MLTELVKTTKYYYTVEQVKVLQLLRAEVHCRN